jgi:ribonuclease BN (tRNA processing enzyme)
VRSLTAVSLTVTVLGASGSYAGPGGACSGYLLRSPGATVVVDLGPGTLARLQEHVAVADVDALVLSHEHPDHWLDVPILRNAMRYYLGLDGLRTYGPAGVVAAARALVGEVEPTLLPATVAAGDTVSVGDLTLAFARTDHPVETLAVRVSAGDDAVPLLLYTADTGPGWDPVGWADGVGLLLCEATVAPGDENPVHLSSRQAGELARRLGAGRLVVTHVAPGVDGEAQRATAAAAFGGPVGLAVPGATFTA